MENNNSYFINCLKAELIRNKRTFAFWLTLIAGGLIPLIRFAAYFFRPEFYIPDEGDNPWLNYLDQAWMNISSFLLPFFIVLLISLMLQVEHRANSWKHLFVMPVSRKNYYLSKFLVINILIILFYLIFTGLLFSGGFILSVAREGLKFHEYSPHTSEILTLTSKSYLSVLAMAAIHYWLSIRFKNFIVPVGIGLAGIIAASAFSRGWDYVVYFPYAYPPLTVFKYQELVKIEEWGAFSVHEIYSVILCAIFLFLGYWNLKKQNIY